jgi:hypothetical protein
MERYCSTGQSPQRAVAPTEDKEGHGRFIVQKNLHQPSHNMTAAGFVIAGK